MIRGIAAGLIGCFLVLFASTGHYSTIAANEAQTTGTLRRLFSAEIDTASHLGGFSEGLGSLGVLDTRSRNVSSTGFLRNGYRFTYRPGPRSSGKVSALAIVARPLLPLKTGVRSFFVDESLIIRATSEDRDATVHDNPI